MRTYACTHTHTKKIKINLGYMHLGFVPTDTRVLGAQELELQAVVSHLIRVLRIKPAPSRRTVRALSH